MFESRQLFLEGSPQAAGRLFRLGLEENWLHDAVDYSLSYASECTANDPPNMAGMLIWGKTTRSLRDTLKPKGWTSQNQRNYPITVSPDGQYAIVVAAGDSFTGRIDGTPATRNERGPAAKDAVMRNQFQLYDYSKDFPSVTIRQTWFLLHYAEMEEGEVKEVRLELSLPDGFTENGIVDKWGERILLRPVTNDLDPQQNDETEDEGEDYNITIERI